METKLVSARAADVGVRVEQLNYIVEQSHDEPVLIALTGRSSCHRRAVARLLVEQLGFSAIEFHDALRREVAEAWRVDVRSLAESSAELPRACFAVGSCSVAAFKHWCVDCGESLTESRSSEWILQRWDTYRRRFDPQHFVRVAERWILRQRETGLKRIVISDVVERSQVDSVRRLGARILHVGKPSEVSSSSTSMESAADWIPVRPAGGLCQPGRGPA